MRFITYILLSILSVFCFSQAQGQGVSAFGANRPQDSSKTRGQIVATAYATNLPNLFLRATATGHIVLDSVNAGSSYIAGYGVVVNNDTINIDSALLNGTYLKIGDSIVTYVTPTQLAAAIAAIPAVDLSGIRDTLDDVYDSLAVHMTAININRDSIIAHNTRINNNTIAINNAWMNGGNSFGAASSIGTNDNNAFRIRVNNSIYHYFFPSGNVGLAGQSTDAGFAADIGGSVRAVGNLSAGSSGTTGTTLRGDAILFANQASTMIKRNHGTGMTGLHYGSVEGGGAGWKHYYWSTSTGWTARFNVGTLFITSSVNTTDIAQSSNGILELASTTAVFYPPRMTSTQRNAITVVAGAEVYDATASKQSTYERHKWVYQKTINDTTFSGSTLTVNAWNNYYIFNGTTTTATFPALTSTNKEIQFINIGTGNATLNSNAGGNDFYDMSTGTATNTITIPPNTALGFLLNGTYFITQ